MAAFPRAVKQFILGDESLNISAKFFGDDALVDRAIVTLLGKTRTNVSGNPGRQNPCYLNY